MLKVVLMISICLLALQNEASDDAIEHIVETKKLTETLEPGMAIRIIGTTPHFGSHFTVSLRESYNHEDADGDIGLHAYFKYNSYSDKLVLNSYEGGQWWEEEVHEGLPDRYYGTWKNGVDLRILATQDHFEITYNKRKWTFEYRTLLKNIEFVIVGGHIILDSITLEKKVGDDQYKRLD